MYMTMTQVIMKTLLGNITIQKRHKSQSLRRVGEHNKLLANLEEIKFQKVNECIVTVLIKF